MWMESESYARVATAVCVLFACYLLANAQQEPLVPAMFVFGDSLVDNGNNNYIPSIARANFYPYGIDFPLGPTGRFCNGRTVLDVLGDILSLPFLPAYLNPETKGSAILRGVNYASGAGGIVDASGAAYLSRLPFDKQIHFFQNTLSNLTAQLGDSTRTSEYLSKSLIAIVFGSNDFINNYLMPKSSSHQYSPGVYHTFLIETFTQQLKTLYHLGARRFLIAGVGPLGCIPREMAAKSKDGQCIHYINDLVLSFNSKVKQMLEQLNSDPSLPGARFIHGNIYDAVSDMIENPAKYGFNDVRTGCCGVGRFNGQLTCIPSLADLCSDRNKHVFWDAFHPSEAVNFVLAKKLFEGSKEDVSPMNVSSMLLTT